jgi:ATP-dependent helicase/nuclease subunit B
VPDPTAPGQVVSPTALETWAGCPHAYFVERLLRVEPVESPEELVEISPMEVGNLIHQVMDRFFTEQVRARAGPQRWTAQQRDVLRRITLEVAAEFEARGVTGHRLLWQQELGRILTDLQLLLDDDEKLRAETGRRQVRSELAFGMGGPWSYGCPTAGPSGSGAAPTGSTGPARGSWWWTTRPAAPASSRT